ncbi:MAG: glycerol-3-phosphate dehydrogenase, partial [Paracoccaceae bacterium]
VALNARDAAQRGATVLTRTLCESAKRRDGLWQVTLAGPAGRQTVRGRALVNAAGPWVEQVLRERIDATSADAVRLVRGSHIVTRRLFDHDQPYFFQLNDGRIIFAIPYETDFTLIGTTDADYDGDPDAAVCTPEERAYLLAAASRFLREPVDDKEVVWGYSGVPPLYNDNAALATAATRHYVLRLAAPDGGAALLSVFGGKITTFRRLAELALDKLAPHLPTATGGWTADSVLPGGNFAVGGVADLVAKLRADHDFLDARWALRLVRAYGTEATTMLDGATKPADLGRHFGWNLTEREVNWLRNREFAETAQDILWRRSKIGLRLSEAETAALKEWSAANPL